MTYETKIDSMTITIERLEKQILILTSNITGLEEEVYKKRDVESQLKEALDRELESQDARNALQKD